MIPHALGMSMQEAAPAKAADFAWFEIEPDPAGWDDLLRAHPPGLFHLGPVLAAHALGGYRPRGVVVRDSAGAATAVVGGLLRRADGETGFSMLSFPPLAATREPALVESLTEWLFEQGVNDIEIHSADGGVEEYWLPAAAALRERLEFVWDLGQSEEQRLRALRSNHKRKLQKLRTRSDLELREIRRWQPELLTWLRIEWARRHERLLGLRQLVELYGYHRHLNKSLGRSGIGRLYGLYQGRTLLTAAYMLEADGTAFYMIGASSPAGYQLNASLKLFWDLAERYAARGFRRLHFGGVPAAAESPDHEEHGVLRFKAGFGIEPAKRLSLSIRK